MPRVCTVCTHPEREEIDDLLVGGFANRRIAARYDVTEQAVRRHKENHLPALLAQARQTLSADSLVARLEYLGREAHRIRMKAEAAGDLKVALAGLRELARLAELQAKLLGELEPDGATVVNVLVSPEWQQLRALILRALERHPAARLDVAAALVEAERHAPN